MNTAEGLVVGHTSELLLVLLIAGHLLGDFAFQTGAMAAAKNKWQTLLAHTSIVTLAHLVAVGPLLSWRLAVLILLVGGIHALIDLVKSTLRPDRQRQLRVFVIDQMAHITVLIGAWAAFVGLAGVPVALVTETALATFTTVMVVVAAIPFNAVGGRTIVSGVLALQDPNLEEEEELKKAAGARDWGVKGSGSLIGILERTLSLILIILGQWAAIAILMAAKSIARFDELKERRFSEYYLIGTLTSLLVAVVTGWLVVRVLALI